MVNMSSPATNLIADSVKSIIGERVLDMHKTYKDKSYKAGRKERVKNFRDFLNGAVIDIIWSNAGQITMSTVNTLYNFDWNKSDTAIQAQIESNNAAMAGSLGGLAASYIGRSAGLGVLKSVAMQYPKINLDMLADAKDDNLEEIRSSISGAVMAMRSNLMSSAMISTYSSGRQLLQMAGIVNPGNEPWILSEELDKVVEKQQNPLIKSAMSRFKDEMEDVVFDNFAIISNTLSASYVMNYQAAKAAQGKKRVISFTPDKTEPENKVLMYGNEDNLIAAIESARLGQSMLAPKDVGSIVAMHIDQALKADRNEKLITVFFRNGVNGGTYLPNGDKAAEKKLVIPNVKPTISALDLKAVLTNIQGGSYRVTAKMADGHHIILYAASEGEGKSVIKRIAEKCCKSKIVEFTVNPPSENVNKRVEGGLFVPTSCWFTQHKDVASKTKSSRVYADGKFYETKTTKVNLRKPISKEIDNKTRYPFSDISF